MKLIKSIAAAAVISSFAASASAQDSDDVYAKSTEYYGNIGVEALDLSGASGNIVGRAGYDFHENFALEGEGAVGVLDDNDGFKIDYRLSAFGRGKIPVGEQFEVFARAGYHVSGANGQTVDGLAFGAGVEYFLGSDQRHSIRADYTNLRIADGFSADVYAVAYGIRF